MKIIIFGAGNFYQKQKRKLKNFRNIEIIAFADNNSELWGKYVDDVVIIPPDSLQTQNYDAILIMSNLFTCQIYRQLIDLGVDKERIIEWERLCAEQYQGNIQLFHSKKKILIVSQALNYDGGSLASIYAAKALKERGISVVLSVPGGNLKLINEVSSEEIPIIICPTLPYTFEMEKRWIGQFDVVIVNLLTMVESACEINEFCPVLWWIHEPALIYELLMQRSVRFVDTSQFMNISIYAVSSIAQNNFNRYVLDMVTKKLMIGIPDTMNFLTSEVNRDKKTIFAIIGTVYNNKAQDIFLRAVSNIKRKTEAEFWIIGKMSNDDYCNKIVEAAEKIESVRLFGEMTRAELNQAFHNIDVVVCISQEETVSMTIVEAMMYGKVCITTKNTGVAEYIQHGINGFVISTNNVPELSKTMEWVIANIDKAYKMGQAARVTYEKYFTMDLLGERLETALEEVILKWEKTN